MLWNDDRKSGFQISKMELVLHRSFWYFFLSDTDFNFSLQSRILLSYGYTFHTDVQVRRRLILEYTRFLHNGARNTAVCAANYGW